MATYSVIAQDGQMYGPVDERGMSDWIRQGRVNRQSTLHCHETNSRTAAWAVTALQPALGLSPEEVSRLLRGAPNSGPAPLPPLDAVPMAVPMATPADYRQPQTFGGPTVPMVSQFPVFAVVLLSIFVPLFPVIYYGLIHGSLPQRRPDDPGAGKAIGFMFIPFFNIYWVCFFWTRLCTRINDERMRVGLPPTAPRDLVIAICWCHLGLIVPFLNILVGIAIAIMMVISLIKIQESINELADAARVRYVA